MPTMMRLGSRGDNVRQLQLALVATTALAGLQLAADGIFGPKTDQAVRDYQQWLGLEVDGIAGPDTLAALAGTDNDPGKDDPTLPALHPVYVARVKRIRSAVRQGIQYKLSRGGYNPKAKLPGRPGRATDTNTNGADCSGTLAWGFQMKRGPRSIPPNWIESTQLYRDVTGPQRTFRRVYEPFPGCGVAYPDDGRKQGHVGIVTEVHPALRGVDCSSSRSKATGQAITERGFEFFRSNGAIFFVLNTDPEPFA